MSFRVSQSKKQFLLIFFLAVFTLWAIILEMFCTLSLTPRKNIVTLFFFFRIGTSCPADIPLTWGTLGHFLKDKF